MAVVNAFNSPSTGQFTAGGVDAMAGQRLVIAMFDRSGGVEASVETGDPLLTAALAPVPDAQVATLPDDGNSRRSLFVWDGIIPAGVAQSPVVTCTVVDGTETPVSISVVAAVVEEGDGWGLAQVVSAASGVSTVGSLDTGTTPQVPAGDILALAVETTRGATTATWTLTDNTPPNPGGGDWDLSIGSGSGASQRRGSIGYHADPAAAAQTWSDTVTYGTARMATAALLVYSTGASGVARPLAGTADAAAAHQGGLRATRPLAAVANVAALFTGSLTVTAKTIPGLLTAGGTRPTLTAGRSPRDD